VVIFFVLITIVTCVIAGVFVHRHEAQLTAEAERAMPGPLKLH
jgi:hypothetical protein